MNDTVDLLIIGGGINGVGIARDAAGRGLSVVLAEQNDLASSTSSASTKLFHGGLRYLEYFEIGLVRKALIEREVLLSAMPHISWPMRFVLPLSPDMRFDSDTLTSRLLRFTMPWLRGRRPAWLIRLGLFLYDHLGGRKILPGTTRLNLTKTPEGTPLKPHLTRAYEYSDCWVQDSRLVVLNARDAQNRGAHIRPRTRVVAATPGENGWQVTLQSSDEVRIVHARAVVNAAGPWVADVIANVLNQPTRNAIRLVRGSHIITRRLYDHDKCYFFQGPDGRIVFAIPYEQDFTLIGTTDVDHPDPDTPPRCSEDEIDYLCDFTARYFAQPVTPDDVVSTYSGTRPLFDDGASSASAATRDYVLDFNESTGAPLLNVFGGKITTYRKLAEEALDALKPIFPALPGDWTAGVPLPGGDFPVNGVDRLIADFRAANPWADAKTAQRLIRAYGTEAQTIFVDGPGNHFGHGLYEAEINWLIAREWVQTTDDLLWRRTKLGLRFTEDETKALANYITARR
ncbi:glycerol-3-phosphate dehydrogenase [Alisedimentitalea sp. MJ-SS2]|uniref:glycerol-3-phosphate dehydrogenase n=1 Tax=Aliisedimentitalea sp. MJ-SS2 TaxID=3049795 RepID=UPI00290F7F4F|nr:glycerol-3-phosphate dehydrogenase [Alisedimentitalea sp. MJ-SS2]MDU8927141.1 glycerol-3-phosphate dehydrogenase [Alisedimentitalea sp. MJ-SS2]